MFREFFALYVDGEFAFLVVVDPVVHECVIILARLISTDQPLAMLIQIYISYSITKSLLIVNFYQSNWLACLE